MSPRGVSEYYHSTRGLVGSSIIEYASQREVLNNNTIGLGIEVNPERHKHDFTKHLRCDL